MGRLELARDPISRLFTLPAMAPRPNPQGGADPFVRMEMIVDSGSNGTAISEDVATELGIAVHALRRRGASGIGLPTAIPVIEHFEF